MNFETSFKNSRKKVTLQKGFKTFYKKYYCKKKKKKKKHLKAFARSLFFILFFFVWKNPPQHFFSEIKSVSSFSSKAVRNKPSLVTVTKTCGGEGGGAIGGKNLLRLECLLTGLLECLFKGLLECLLTGLLECLLTGLLECLLTVCWNAF